MKKGTKIKWGELISLALLVFLFLTSGPSAFSLEKPNNEGDITYRGDDGDKESLLKAVENSLSYLEYKLSAFNSLSNLSPKNSLISGFKENQRILKRLRELLLANLDKQIFKQKIQEEFHFQRISKEAITLTGYFEPIYSGRLKEEEEYKYPLYRPPDDLVAREAEKSRGAGQEKLFGRWVKGNFVPYYSRREIDTYGALKGKGYEIVWLKDPWERFLLHVQGSGKIVLPSGEICRVGYAANNGRPYRSIGRYLVNKGFIKEEELSLRKIREFLQQHPEMMEEILNQNEKYIFFRFIFTHLPDEGPIGALDLPLIPGRSIATDHAIYPPGGLAYLISTMPIIDESGRVLGRKKINRFVLNHDKGAAMRGPARVDLFIGSGEKAEQIAGEMNEAGRIFIIKAK